MNRKFLSQPISISISIALTWFAFFIIDLIQPICCHALPSFEEIKSSYKTSEAYILDHKGRELQAIRKDFNARRLKWVELKDLSPVFIDATLTSEDKRFYDHKGVDWIAAGSAIVDNLMGKGKRGASTITMQLAGLINRDIKRVSRPRTLYQKWNQAKIALEIEKHWTKNQILEAYLNLVSFRGEIQGIGAASWILLSKSPSGLNPIESALLAAIIRHPSASKEYIALRTSLLLKKMEFAHELTEINTFIDYALSKGNYRENKNSSLTYTLPHLNIKAGESLITTIDKDIQQYAIDVLRRNILALKRANVNDGAILVLHNASGHIVAYVGNGGKLSSAPFVDGVRTKRQAGSTLKPFLYGLAIDKGLLDGSSLLEDSPIDIYTERGLYKPQNYNNDYRGTVTLRNALASSLNTPAVKTLMLLGIEDFHSKLLDFGFNLPEGPEYYGYSIALGAVDVSLYELVRAYRVLNQKGNFTEINFLKGPKKPKSRQVISPEAAFIISDILSDRSARSLTFGFENPLSTRFWTAVKTGTSKDMRDNWCIGFSDTFTVGVWVGNFSGSPMWNVSGISGAAQIWLEMMNYLHRNKRSLPPSPPMGIIARPVDSEEADYNKSIREWYIKDKGTETNRTMMQHRTASPPSQGRIIYPPTGSIFAIDPDIPKEAERIFFEIEGYREGMKLHLDNEPIEITKGFAQWNPTGGIHWAYLIDTEGKTIDKISIQVRGAKPSQGSFKP